MVLPLRLTREQCDKLFPAVRRWHSYTNDQRTTLAIGCTGHRARASTGFYFYQHPLLPTTASRTAKEAKEWGWARYRELEEAEWKKIATLPE